MSSKDQFAVTPLAAWQEGECDMQIRMLPMRDGMKLHTTVFLPPELKNPVGTILIRSPYFRRGFLPLPDAFAMKNGFAAVYQHCRGTASSEGAFFPTHPELEEHDGEDTLDWIVQQPWSNGKVTLIGSSYSGWTQWTAAFSGHKAITGLRPHVAAVYSCASMALPGGGSYLGFMVSWGLSMYHRNRFGYEDVPNFDTRLDHLPVNELDTLFNYGPVEFFRDFIHTTQHPARNRKAIADKFSAVTAPALISGGWFDPFKDENFDSFALIRNNGATPRARELTRLIMGPWGHGGLLNKDIFGEENDHRDLTKLQNRFTINSLRDPEADPLPEQPVVQFFLLGENRWCSCGTWPPANKEKSLFLQEGNRLAEAPSAAEESISSYNYDPADATPSFNGSRTSVGYFDYSKTEKRSDVVTFTTAPLAEPLTIAGNVKVRLYARSSAPDTDFYATLTDVYPDGRSMFLTTGMVRARFSKSLEEEHFLTRGEIRTYEISLGAIANTFGEGHAVRLSIHSANFPSNSRNLNTVTPVNEGVKMVTAFQEIFHDQNHPSELFLPVSCEKL